MYRGVFVCTGKAFAIKRETLMRMQVLPPAVERLTFPLLAVATDGKNAAENQ